MAFDAVKYEIFSHRLFNILEEGRISMQMVSGSPVVVEGGETMCAFYTASGKTILVAAGILLHCVGANDFVLKAIEWYEKDPGINDGDQFFFNDPYIGGQHACDQVVLKPIFFQGRRIAWVGSIMHTPETGAMEPGGMPAGATEIYHEGIRFYGLKIVEAAVFRKEVFNSITLPTRDPVLVGLDIKAKIAANNVCAKGYLRLVEKFGLPFVDEAAFKIIDDSEKMARARLMSLPDGVWRSRMYGDSDGVEERPFKVVCTMSISDDRIKFDFTGSSPQNRGSINSTHGAAWGSLFVALCSQLFWNIPWNGGLFAPVDLIAPAGTVVNCLPPAACSVAPHTTGSMISESAHECIAKMLYAAGVYEDVNSGWIGARRNPCGIIGGFNQYGRPFSGTVLDTFAGGVGAATCRDGVDSGANMMNPTACISDVEMIEQNLPLVYLARNHSTDSGGFGKYDGGMAIEAVYMVYGSSNVRIGSHGLGKKVAGGFGMFGGYPPALQEVQFILAAGIEAIFKKSKTMTSLEEAKKLGGRKIDLPAAFPPIPMKPYDIIIGRMCAGGGYGDPIERDPLSVEADVKNQAVSRGTAEIIYGIALNGKDSVDRITTAELRKRIKASRLSDSLPVPLRYSGPSPELPIL